MEKDIRLCETIPLPTCSVDQQGKILYANKKINHVFLYDKIIGADIFALTGIKYEELERAKKEEEPLVIKRNDRFFKMLISKSRENKDIMTILFVDITRQEDLFNQYEDEKPCIAVVEIDNYDELIGDNEEVEQAVLKSKINGILRQWASEINASVTRQNAYRYVMVFQERYLREQEEKKFEILDQVRNVDNEGDFPITLSIGIGSQGNNLDETDVFSLDALDAARGRGGDQAVVKKKNELDYYGGTTQTVEKSNKGKSRIIGQALRVLAKSASKVLIMGHQNLDMDSFGSAVGTYRLILDMNKETYIVVEQYSEGMSVAYNAIKETGQYNLINNKKAKNLVDEETLVIVVDTHRPSITECPELLEHCGRVAVIDHHRKGEEFIQDPTISYTEPYASSAAELVTEMLQYTIDRKNMEKLEAEVLLAGMTVDTNRFSVKAGVRTFEAAAWLKRAGADTAEVKRFFQLNIETFSLRAKGIAGAEITEEGYAFALCPGENINAQIINAQIADELLTVRGVKASFSAGKNQSGKTVISARSIGNLNVHILMEKMGGGGHLNTAGAQIEGTPQEAIEKIKEILEEKK